MEERKAGSLAQGIGGIRQKRATMGIRVNKVVGYGLTDLRYKRDKHHLCKEMSDPRIDWDGFGDMCDRAYATGGPAFMSWAEKNWEDLLRLETEEWHLPMARVKEFSSICPFLLKDFFKRHKEWNLGRCIVHRNEFGLPGVLLLVPPMQAHEGVSGWMRHDDTIDWIEESMLHQARNRVVKLPCTGIYPYEGTMVRFRDPPPGIWTKPVPASEPELKIDSEGRPVVLPGQAYNMLIGRWDPGRLEPMAQGALLEHLKNDWRPRLPSELLALLWWMRDCFEDFSAVRDGLRPLLYVHWG
jgi:hypothetical protein